MAKPSIASHDDVFSKEGLFESKDSSTLPHFTLALHPNTPIATGETVLWCNTMQLAWNEAIGLVGEKLRFANQPDVVDHLNAETYSKSDLDDSCYVAFADFEKNHVEQEIHELLQKKFNGEASPKLIPEPPANPGPEDFLAYAYLFKNLAFQNKFVRNNPMVFLDTKVKCFGFMEEEAAKPELLSQVVIDDYQSPNDFVIELKTKSENDQLILAKITPNETLEATIKSVMSRVNSPSGETVTANDKLSVPLLNFDLTQHFKQLEGLVLTPSPSAKVHRLEVTTAMQNIRFQLDEEGVKLKSEAAIAMKALAMLRPPKNHLMLFDSPFLVIMKQKNATQPYFAMWAGNSMLLVPDKGE